MLSEEWNRSAGTYRWGSHATTTFGAALKKGTDTGTNSVWDVVLAAWKTSNVVAAQTLGCTSTHFGGPNEPQVAAKESKFANLSTRRVSCHTKSLGGSVDRNTTRMADAKAILTALKEERNVVAINCFVAAAACIHHAATGVSFSSHCSIGC